MVQGNCFDWPYCFDRFVRFVYFRLSDLAAIIISLKNITNIGFSFFYDYNEREYVCVVVSIQDVYKVLLLNVQYIKQISTFLIKPKSCQLPVPGMRSSLAEKQQIPILVFGLTRLGLEPTIYHTRGEPANHYTTDAVYLPKLLFFFLWYV